MRNVSQIQEFYSGENFVKRIDTILEQMHKKRQDLCEATGISPQAISNWKSLNRMPTVDAAIAISLFLKVEPEWLLTGQLSWDGYSETQPCQIYSRLYNLLKDKTKAQEPVSPKELHDYVKDIVDDSTLTNWSENRSIPDPEILYRLADYLGTSLPFLLANITGNMTEHPGIEGKKISLEEYNDFCNYKKNIQLTHLFATLKDSDKKLITEMLTRLQNNN